MEKTLEGEAAKFVKENQGRIIVGWERLAEEKRRIGETDVVLSRT